MRLLRDGPKSGESWCPLFSWCPMPLLSRKRYHQAVVFSITFLYIAVNHGQRSVMASSKLIQEKEQKLPIDRAFHARSDFFMMVGMATGSYYLGRLSDHIDLRTMLIGYSLVAGGLFAMLAFFMDQWFVLFLGSIRHFHSIIHTLMFLNGFVYSACYPACAGLVLTWIDEQHRGRLATIWAGSLNVGGVAFYQLSYYTTATLGLDWRINYYLTCIIFLFLAIMTHLWLQPYPEQLGIVIQQCQHLPPPPLHRGLTEGEALNEFFRINYVQVILSIYAISITGGSVLDFWLYAYLQNQGLYVSAHEISQLYESFSFLGGLGIGWLLDRRWKHQKVSVFCGLFLVSGVCFLGIQYHYQKIVYFVVVSLIGLAMGANQNYLVSVTAKLLLDHPQVQATGLQIATMVGLLETFSSTFLMLNFYFIPRHLDQLFLILGLESFLAAALCLPQVLQEQRSPPAAEHQPEQEGLLAQ